MMIAGINVSLGDIPTLNIALGNIPKINIGAQNIIVNPTMTDVEKYDGSYSILPLPEAQILPTAKRYCLYDITVRAIPFYEISNASGGTTVVIDKL